MPHDPNSEEQVKIQAYIHSYVDLSPQFERIGSYYVLFSWLYDNTNGSAT